MNESNTSSAHLYNLLQQDAKVKPHITKSLTLISSVIKKYGIKGIALSFNGGKDCTVLIHLVRAALSQMNIADPCLKELKIIYFATKNEFKELNKFMYECGEKYSFKILKLDGDFKSGLDSFLSQYEVKAILMGQRRVDPGMDKIDEIAQTDSGWPDFLRVNPILNWTYIQVWDFLRSYSIPYCSLYDQGYTSLGSSLKTLKNPFLKTSENNYLPAYFLANGKHERAGRVSKPVTQNGENINS